jgi:hypothetical protein
MSGAATLRRRVFLQDDLSGRADAERAPSVLDRLRTRTLLLPISVGWHSPTSSDTFDRYDVPIGGITWHVKDSCFQKSSSARRPAGRPAWCEQGGIARDLGIGANLLGRWCRDANVDAEVTVGREKVSSQEYERMRRELAKVKTERDILKRRSATSHPTSSEVQLYRQISNHLGHANDVSFARRIKQ